MTQSITHRNHYIPRFYLKNWSLDGKTILTYSILVSNSKVPYWTQQSIKNSAVWNDFYRRLLLANEQYHIKREIATTLSPSVCLCCLCCSGMVE